MRRNTRALAAIAAQTMRLPQPIVEFGSFQVTGNAMEDLRPIFAGKQYIGCDVRPGPGVDRVENLEHLTFEAGSIGTIVLLDTLEHVQDPVRAMDEAFRALQPDGICIASSVMDLFIHCEPDYWRFTPAAFRYLFDNFGETLVGHQGNPEKPHTVFAIGVKQPSRSYTREFAAIESAYRQATRTLYWRVAQPYYVARDAFRMFQRNNAVEFERKRAA